MSTTTLGMAAAFAALTALVYAFVGWHVARRHVSGDARVATLSFAIWWFGIGGLTGIEALRAALGAGGLRHVAIYVALDHLVLVLLTVSLAGLLYYLLYLFAGSRRVIYGVGAFYGAFYIMGLYVLAAGEATDVEVRRFAVAVEYISRPEGLVVLLLLMLLLPAMLGALAYASLWMKVRDRTARYRIGLVSLTILLWFGSSLVAWLTALSSVFGYWPLVSRSIGLVAALTIYAAYRPPRWVQRKYRVNAIDARAP